MTIYVRPHRLGGTTTPGAAPLPRSVGTDPFAAPVDPLDPKTTVYWDMAVTEAELPVELAITANEVSYDPDEAGMVATNVQAALDELDGRVDDAELDIIDLQDAVADLDNKTGLATTTVAGIIELATQAEVDAGVDIMRAVTPATLEAKLADVTGSAPATETVAGIAEIATQAETDAGIDDSRIVSPLKLAPLAGRVTAAEADIDALQAADVTLDSRLDTVEAKNTEQDGRLTAAEADVDALQAADVTLDGRLDTVEGKVTTAEGDIDALQAADVTLDSRLDAAESDITALEGKTNPATEAAAGIAELATQAEVNAGADDARIVTPLKLRNLNGWHVGPLGIGRAPTSLLDVFSATTAVITAEAPAAGLYLKNATLTWQVLAGPAKLLIGHQGFPTTRTIAMNVAGEVAVGSDTPLAGVSLFVNGQVRAYGPVLAYGQVYGDTYGMWASGDIRMFQAYTNNYLSWNGLDSTWRFFNGGVERMTITGGNGVFFNGIGPAVIDNQSRLCVRTYTMASRPAASSVPDGTLLYVPDSPSYGPLQIKHGGAYYAMTVGGPL